MFEKGASDKNSPTVHVIIDNTCRPPPRSSRTWTQGRCFFYWCCFLADVQDSLIHAKGNVCAKHRLLMEPPLSSICGTILTTREFPSLFCSLEGQTVTRESLSCETISSVYVTLRLFCCFHETSCKTLLSLVLWTFFIRREKWVWVTCLFLIWSKFAGMLVYCWVTVDLMQLTSSPRITKCETDSGWKSRYYAIIFSGKKDHGLWSLSTVEQFSSSFLTTAGSDFTFTPRMHKV